MNILRKLIREPYIEQDHTYMKLTVPRLIYHIFSVLLFILLITKVYNNLVYVSLSVLFLITFSLAEILKNHVLAKYLMAYTSFFAFYTIIYMGDLDYFYMAKFVYYVPILFAFLLHEPFTVNITAFAFVFLFVTYRGKVPSEVIEANIYSMICASVSQTGISYFLDEMKSERNKYLQASFTDSLTGVKTLEFVIKVGEDMLENKRDFLTLIIDLDHFKSINDTYGHVVGNSILIQVANVLKNEVEDYNGIVGRLGGDEFIILIPQDKALPGKIIKDTIYKRLFEQKYYIDKEISPIEISFSLGASNSSEHLNISMQDLVHMADMEMYIAKFHGHAPIEKDKGTCADIPMQAQEVLKVLSQKDLYTYIHSKFTAYYAKFLGQAIRLSEDAVNELYIAGWMHDIGKILISGDILRKLGKLDDFEYTEIKKHVRYGLGIIDNLEEFNVSEKVANAILYHHERWDGTGYPDRAAGTDIPLEGRILQIADAFSAMTIRRVYNKPKTWDEAAEELHRNSGTQFDPQLVDVFVTNLIRREKILSSV